MVDHIKDARDLVEVCLLQSGNGLEDRRKSVLHDRLPASLEAEFPHVGAGVPEPFLHARGLQLGVAEAGAKARRVGVGIDLEVSQAELPLQNGAKGLGVQVCSRNKEMEDKHALGLAEDRALSTAGRCAVGW
jgi:hypothetical protein